MQIRMAAGVDWRSVRFDWNRARAFLVTAEEGSLSSAARALGLAQPTLGRQVAALEEELGVALFERSARGLALTPTGLELLDHARAMGAAAARISLAASGRSSSIEGVVAVSASEAFAAYILAPLAPRLRRAFPGLTLEIVASNSLSDLRRREADIAVRNVEPTDPTLTARKIGQADAKLYAAPSYIDAHGPFENRDALARAAFVGLSENAAFLEGLKAMGVEASEENFVAFASSHITHWELVKAGAGIGVMASRIGDAEPAVREAAPWAAPFRFPIWLVAHRELATSRRIRAVFDFLVEALRENGVR